MVDEITPRERFKKVMNFQKPDQLPWMEYIPEVTIMRWIREGLPLAEAVQLHYNLSDDGAMLIVSPVHKFDVSKHFGVGHNINPSTNIYLDFGPLPRYSFKILGEAAGKVLCRNQLGGKMRYIGDYAMPHFLDFPVKNMKDWVKYKERFNPNDPRRYPKDFTKEQYIELFEEASSPTSLIVYGFYAFGRSVMGTSAFIPAFYTDPDLIQDMMDMYACFLIEVLKEAVESLKSRIDWVFWHEDIAHGVGPNISPKIFKKFLYPNFKKVISFLNNNGIKLIILDSDGDFRALMPLFWDVGIRGTWPLEVNAGMDAVELRKQYGKTWRLIGNIDKRVLTKGRKAIKDEINTKLPYLKEEGGYIPGLDHAVPPNVSLENFVFYSKYIQKML